MAAKLEGVYLISGEVKRVSTFTELVGVYIFLSENRPDVVYALNRLNNSDDVNRLTLPSIKCWEATVSRIASLRPWRGISS